MTLKLTKSTRETRDAQRGDEGGDARRVAGLIDPDRRLDHRKDLVEKQTHPVRSQPPLGQSDRLEECIAVGHELVTLEESREHVASDTVLRIVTINEGVERGRIDEYGHEP